MPIDPARDSLNESWRASFTNAIWLARRLYFLVKVFTAARPTAGSSVKKPSTPAFR